MCDTPGQGADKNGAPPRRPNHSHPAFLLTTDPDLNLSPDPGPDLNPNPNPNPNPHPSPGLTCMTGARLNESRVCDNTEASSP